MRGSVLFLRDVERLLEEVVLFLRVVVLRPLLFLVVLLRVIAQMFLT